MDRWTDEQADAIIERIASAVTANRSPRSSWDRVGIIVAIILSVGGVIFSAGVLSSRVSSLEKAISDETLARQSATREMSRRVDANGASIVDLKSSTAVSVERLTRIQADVAEIKGLLNNRR